MAYAIVPPAMVEVTIHSTISAQTCLTMLHWYLASSFATVTDGHQELVNIWERIQPGAATDVITPFVSCMGLGTSVDFCRVQWVWPQRYQAFQNAVNLAGGVINATVNPSVAAVISRSGDIARKGRRSNLHMPGLPTSFIANGSLTAAAVNTYQVFGVATMQNLVTPTGHTYTPVIYNRANPASSIVITTVIPSATARTMRRRVVGRGI